MKRKSTDWIVIHMVHSRAKAEEIEQKLTEEGCWVRIRPLSASDEVFEILTLPSEAREAQLLIMRMGS